MMTSEWPRMAVCLLTYERTEYAVRTVQSVCRNFQYENLAWYIADDGSRAEHVSEIVSALEAEKATVFGSHSERLGPGPSWNLAIEKALGQADFVLWLEDDWELNVSLQIEPYVKLLQEVREVGMVRLAHMAIDLDLYSVGHNGIHYLRVEKSQPYTYSGNPSIRSRRYFRAYDWYPKTNQANPGECELWHDDHMRRKETGPEVWWPINLPGGGWGPFGHIGQKQSY